MKIVIASIAFVVLSIVLAAASTTDPPTTTTTAITTTPAPTPTEPPSSAAPSSISTQTVTTQTDGTTTSANQSSTTTTEVPVTTTSAVVTTTASPLPDKPDVGNWTVHDGKNYCIRADMGVRLEIKYNTTDNKTLTETMDIPVDHSVTEALGSCKTANVDQPYIQLTWQPQAGGLNKWNFTFTFNVTEEKVFVGRVDFTYVLNTVNFPGAIIPEAPTASRRRRKRRRKVKDHNALGPLPAHTRGEVEETKFGTYFEVDKRASYLCKTQQQISMGSVTVNLYDLQIQGNMSVPVSSNSTAPPNFDAASECAADLETNNIVPIAVGAALAGLVVIVLIAYLISRNRSKRGYESV